MINWEYNYDHWVDNEPVPSMSNISQDVEKKIFKSSFTDEGPFDRAKKDRQKKKIGYR